MPWYRLAAGYASYSVCRHGRIALTPPDPADRHAQLVELKTGETYNGNLVSCDNFMNVNLRDVIITSKVRFVNATRARPVVDGLGRGASCRRLTRPRRSVAQRTRSR